MNLALDALASFIEDGSLPLPAQGRVLVPRAEYHPLLASIGNERLYLQQTYKLHVDVLERHGFHTETEAVGRFDAALYIPGRSKREGLYWMARALELLDPGGTLFVSAENRLGGKSFRKQLFSAADEVFNDHRSHCVVFAARRRDVRPPLLEEWLAPARVETIDIAGDPDEPPRFHTRLGIFGWDKLDEGSRLLAKTLPSGLSGRCADFGAGFGYLSYHLLRKNPQLAELHLLEAEHLALDAAAKNIAMLDAGAVRLQLLWTNVLEAQFTPFYDAIVMNPPCHDTRGLNVELGRRFIACAAAALVPGGRLYMVANETIDYERTLRPLFAQVERTAKSGGFKVLEASR